MRIPLAAVLAAASLAACNPPSDLGKVCALTIDGGLWVAAVSQTDDYFFNGTAECENLVCLRSAASPLAPGYGICSGPCTPQVPNDPNSPSDDCAGGLTPLVCRAIALDPQFVQSILAEPDGGELLAQYLGGTSAPVLCSTPLADAG